jgi:hypothetical protein
MEQKPKLALAAVLALVLGPLRAEPSLSSNESGPPDPRGLFAATATGPWTVEQAARAGTLAGILAELKASPKVAGQIEARIKAALCQEEPAEDCPGPAEILAKAQRWTLGVYPELLVVESSAVLGRVALMAVLERQGKGWKLKRFFHDEGHYGAGNAFPVLLGGHRYLVCQAASGGTKLSVRRLSFYDIDAPTDAAALHLLTYHGTFDMPNGWAWQVRRISGSGTGPWNLAVSAALSYDGVHNAGGPIYTKQFNFEAPTTAANAKAEAGPADEWPAYLPEPLKVYLGEKGMRLPLLSGDAFMLGARIKNGDLAVARWAHYLLHRLDEDERKDKNVVELQKLVDALPQAKQWTKELKKEDEESR